MSLGSLGGRSEQAQAAAPSRSSVTPVRSQTEIATFTVFGDMTVSLSPKYRVIRGGKLVLVTFEATAAGTGSTVYRVVVDGVVVTSSFTATSSTLSQENTPTGGTVSSSSKMQIEITSAGMHAEAVFQVQMVT